MSKKLLFLLAPIGVIFLIAAFWMTSYNALVTKDEQVHQADAKIAAALQRRADLIPNVVESAKGYMKHEDDVFSKIAAARSKIGSGDKVIQAEGQDQLSSAISRLLVLQENYPELKADQHVSSLMSELEGTENRLFIARKDYNEVATSYNQMIRQFPTNIIANMSGFERAELIKVDESAKTAPKVNFND